MDICETIDLGGFDECEDVVIPEITTTTGIVNLVTRWNCTFDDSDIGRLHKGEYFFSIGSQIYKFQVV